MGKAHTTLTLCNQRPFRKILSMLLMVAMVVSLLPITAYAYNSTVENCTSNMIINNVSENVPQVGKEETAESAVSSFAGGCGTESDPYQIATAEQLNRVRCYLDRHFILIEDIDLSGYENWEPIGIFKPLSDDPEYAETPDPKVAFIGTFNGNGYTIYNLTIDHPEGMSVGLFGCVVGEQESPIHIYDLTVENVNVTGNFCVGGAVGFQYADSILENITLTGDNKVQGNIYVGGILGGSDIGGGSEELRNCNAAADIVLLGDAANSAGVLGGALNACSVINCTATGTVTAEGDDYFALGGLIGGVFEGIKVINCHADDVSIKACGENNTMVGGLLGYAGTYGKQPPTQIAECSADVTITVSNSTERVGGLVGGSFYHELYAEERPVPAFYAISSCSTSGSITGGGNEVGSIAGYAYDSTVENCTSIMTINGVSENIPQVGLYESAFEGGHGTTESPYQIATAEQFDRVRYYLDKDFVLTADIDLARYENWQPIGIFQPASSDPKDEENPDLEVAFTGGFDGNGHIISNVAINQPEGLAVGLFGCAAGEEENPCSIYDLTVENVNVTGNFLTGGVVGLQAMGCTLENISLIGSNTVRGYQGEGGITGVSFGDLRDCDAVAEIVILGDGGGCGGVLVGGTEKVSLINCTATGKLTAEGDNCFGLGGLTGCSNDGIAVTNCHAYASITAKGKNNIAVGGLLGYTGTSDEDNPTQVTGCSAYVTITASDNTTRVGGLVGGSFYPEFYAYAIANCTTSGSITSGRSDVGSIAGYTYNSTVENCTSTVTINGVSDNLPQVGLYENPYEWQRQGT